MKLKVVIDTNIIISGTIKPQGTVGAVLQRLRQGQFTLLFSRETLDEIVSVIHRPRLRLKYHLTDKTVRATLRLLVLRSELVTPNIQVTACRDPNDDKFLEVAISGNANVIVSGDNDLLTLAAYAGIPILPPGQFLVLLDHSI
ncbi:putative toxin-antitoxin system toxin component, PIN family [bacterium]|nr:putative toxin-antitoxin system toxin component, PIN family [bacterium]